MLESAPVRILAAGISIQAVMIRGGFYQLPISSSVPSR